MPELPTGTVTLLFTDIEGSTLLLEDLGRERYAEALARHRDIMRSAFGAHGGYEVDYEGDAFFVAFASAEGCLGAAVAGQRALAAEPWPEECALRVRMGIHTGEPLAVPPKYVGLDVHRAARIMAAGHGEQILLSERTAELVEEELSEVASLRDLGEHRLKDLSRPQRLYQLVIEGLPSEFPPLKTFGNRATNLPVQPNRLIGRTEELAAITGLLRNRETRLLTLTGPGGTGKTRLALHAGAELVDTFADGVFVVFLASLRDPELVLNVIAETLGLRERAGETTEEVLASYLNERNVLLLLDNLEHLLDAASAASKLLASALNLSMLVTSREPLRLAAERLFQVQPLSAPDSATSTTAAALEHDSVALFVERATAAKSDFELTGDNANAIGEICRCLDGLPLAIELAAARIRIFSPEALVQRLDQRLTFLTTGTRDAEERQWTLRATIEWSHELLSAEEEMLFARLAVFLGGFRLDAAEAVCDPGGELGIDLIDGLASLVDKSLLRQRDDPDGEPRFWMLETIREYALERLEASGAADAIARRHAVHYVELAERAEVELRGGSQLTWLVRLDAEQDNVRAALRWSLGNDPELPLRLAGSLYQFWEYRGHWNEGMRSVRESIGRATGGSAHPSYARALFSAGFLAQITGDYERSIRLLENALSLFREANDSRRTAHTLGELGWAKTWRGEIDAARALLESARSLSREIGDTWLLAHATMGLAATFTEAAAPTHRSDAHAAVLSSEALRLMVEAGDEIMAARGRGNLGWLALHREDYEQARDLFEDSLQVATRVGDEVMIGIQWSNLGMLALFEGEPDQAAPWACRFLERFLKLGDKRIAAESLCTLAGVAATRKDPSRAGLLWGAAEAIRESIHSVTSLPESRIYERWLRPAGEASPESFGTALEAGRAMTAIEAVQVALDESLAQAEEGMVSVHTTP
jgi:predicted ATPase/class 3 adenylate cyclase